MTDRDPSRLYETDFLAWAEAQAAALRAAPGIADFGVDLENLIEEVETLARQDFRAFEDGLRGGLSRLVLAAFEPNPDHAKRPLSEVTGHLQGARRSASPTALRRLDLDRVWAEAREEAGAGLPEGALPGASGACPFPVEALLARGLDLRAAVETLRSAARDVAPDPEEP
jgi:hypothetical protein